MKKFTVNCIFNGQKAPFSVYIGEPKAHIHPLQHQAHWLSAERGGTIPESVMNSIAKLRDLAEKNNVSFEELCVYALTTAAQEGTEKNEDNSSNENNFVQKN